MLTEAERNTIKRNIGDVFRKVLGLAEVKIILRKELHDRTEEDFDKLVRFLYKLDKFKNKKKYAYSEMRELAQILQYKEVKKGE